MARSPFDRLRALSESKGAGVGSRDDEQPARARQAQVSRLGLSSMDNSSTRAARMAVAVSMGGIS
jgi:hypothetical protein